MGVNSAEGVSSIFPGRTPMTSMQESQGVANLLISGAIAREEFAISPHWRLTNGSVSRL
jgi:hypothetical protein